MSDILKWRKASEKPAEKFFGYSLEVLGINKKRERGLYCYGRGKWLDVSGSDDFPEVEPPVFWHYLQERPSIEEIEEVCQNSQ